MRTKFYTIHPRNFVNEYTAVKVTTEEEDKRLSDWFEQMQVNDSNYQMYRRTYKELQKLKADEAWARRYDPVFSGYANPEPITVTEFLREDEW